MILREKNEMSWAEIDDGTSCDNYFKLLVKYLNSIRLNFEEF